jgi:hypothetical protein
MARNINDCYDISQYIIRKNRGIFLTVAEFNQNIGMAFLDAIEQWFSGYGANQKIHDALRQLRVYETFTSDSTGHVLFPSNYIHILGTPFTIYGSAITRPDWLNEDKIPFALSSQLRPVSVESPVIVDYAITVSGVTVTGFSIYPQVTHYGAYWYLRLPNTPTLVVTQVGRVLTYDPLNSVQIECNEMYWNNIIAKSLKFSGINMSEQEVTAFSNQYNQETS